MGKIKRLAWWLCFFGVCALLLASGSGGLRRLAETHHGSQYWLLLALLFAIPTSLVTLVAGFLIEWLVVGWTGSSLETLWKARASARLDMISMVLTVLPQAWLGYVFSLGLLYVVDSHEAQAASISVTHWLPTWGLQVACVLLLRSLSSYWMHRLEHAIPALWALHQFHHAADRMSILTAERRSQLMRGVEAVLLFVPFALFTNPTDTKPSAGSLAFVLVAAYFAYSNFLRINSYLCHSNLITDYGWVGRWLLVSPRMHRLHHARAPEYHDRNFSFDLVIWDRLFGTYATCDAATARTVPLGLDDNPFNGDATIKGVLRDYFLTTLTVFWRALRAGGKAWLPASMRRERGPGATAA